MYLNKTDLEVYNIYTPIIIHIKRYLKNIFICLLIGGNNNHSSNGRYYLRTLIYSYYVYLFM